MTKNQTSSRAKNLVTATAITAFTAFGSTARAWEQTPPPPPPPSSGSTTTVTVPVATDANANAAALSAAQAAAAAKSTSDANAQGGKSTSDANAQGGKAITGPQTQTVGPQTQTVGPQSQSIGAQTVSGTQTLTGGTQSLTGGAQTLTGGTQETNNKISTGSQVLNITQPAPIVTPRAPANAEMHQSVIPGQLPNMGGGAFLAGSGSDIAGCQTGSAKTGWAFNFGGSNSSGSVGISFSTPSNSNYGPLADCVDKVTATQVSIANAQKDGAIGVAAKYAGAQVDVSAINVGGAPMAAAITVRNAAPGFFVDGSNQAAINYLVGLQKPVAVAPAAPAPSATAHATASAHAGHGAPQRPNNRITVSAPAGTAIKIGDDCGCKSGPK